MEKLKEKLASPMTVEVAIVESVDEETNTCVVVLLNDTRIPDVRLKAGIDGFTDGMVQVPEVNSSVLVARIGNDVSTRFVIAFSKVVQTLFNGGENGGLVNWPDVKAELDKTNAVVQAIVDTLTGWTPVPNDGGAALKAYFPTQLGAKVVGDFDDKEDDKVLH